MQKFLILLTYLSFKFRKKKKQKELISCSTKYPILLVHGLALRDNNLLFKYWGSIPKTLKEHGASVYFSGHNAYASHKQNAESIKRKINEVLKKTKAKKINIIAHSKGGIESRYMISKLEMQDFVASLTTIGSPHRGSIISTLIMEKLNNKKFLLKLINLLANIFGDKNADSYRAGIELTPQFMEKFNKIIKNNKKVYYQSYTTTVTHYYPNRFWRKMAKILKKYEGPNDGLVSVKSAKWGNYKGIIKGNCHKSLSHIDQVGLFVFSKVKKLEIDQFYINLVHSLKKKGM